MFIKIYLFKTKKNCLKCTIDLVKINNEHYLDELYAFISCLLQSIGKSKSQLAFNFKKFICNIFIFSF